LIARFTWIYTHMGYIAFTYPHTHICTHSSAPLHLVGYIWLDLHFALGSFGYIHFTHICTPPLPHTHMVALYVAGSHTPWVGYGWTLPHVAVTLHGFIRWIALARVTFSCLLDCRLDCTTPFTPTLTATLRAPVALVRPLYRLCRIVRLPLPVGLPWIAAVTVGCCLGWLPRWCLALPGFVGPCPVGVTLYMGCYPCPFALHTPSHVGLPRSPPPGWLPHVGIARLVVGYVAFS